MGDGDGDGGNDYGGGGDGSNDGSADGGRILMLPSELLRARTYRGRMTPLFCATRPGSGADYDLACTLIGYFADAQENGRRRGDLMRRIGLLEPDLDYKLVRGLAALLERRSVFGQARPATLPPGTAPATVRQELFAESARRGLALSDQQRRDIIRTVAEQMRMGPDDVESAMWSDREDNLVLERFDAIDPSDLLLWYNLSLAQTLLFRCTRLEFRIEGGAHWKRVLRDVKRHGLMYSLEYGGDGDGDGNGDGDGDGNSSGSGDAGDGGAYDSITCVLEGPISLFKMTERYGTAMAKVLPSIVQTPAWDISGTITRKTDRGSKVYSFGMSSGSTKGLLRQVIESADPDGGDARRGSGGGGGNAPYDSSVEEAFARRFRQHFGPDDGSGWRIRREPDPLIAGGKAMIPDFVFERFGRRVYLEIVGFWTREYLERKAAKLRALFEGGGGGGHGGGGVDLLVAVDRGLLCSQAGSIPAGRVFAFSKDVPLKPILEHLRRIDGEITEEKISGDVRIDMDRYDPDLVPVARIVEDHRVPRDAALRIIHASRPGAYVEIGSHLVSSRKAGEVGRSLEGITDFVQACGVMASHKIPDSCHARMLSSLGYDVTWPDLDPSNARIARNEKGQGGGGGAR